jgi:hypothetical protein
MKRKYFYNVKHNVTIINKLTNEKIIGDIINEDDIEGRQFFVLRSGSRVLKLAKDAHQIKKEA